MGKEREIFFVNCGKGQKDGKNYYYIDYVNMSNFRTKRDFIDVLSYDRISKKVGDKHLFKCKAILDVNDYDQVFVADIKE